MPDDAVPQNGNPHLPEKICEGIADSLYGVADWDEPPLGYGPNVKYFKGQAATGQAGRGLEAHSKISSSPASSLRNFTEGSSRAVPSQKEKSKCQSPSGSSPRSPPRGSCREGTSQKEDFKSPYTSRSSPGNTAQERAAAEGTKVDKSTSPSSDNESPPRSHPPRQGPSSKNVTQMRGTGK